MAATTTPSINSIVSRLRASYPTLHFVHDKEDHWSFKEKTVYYSGNPASLLHELSHALLEHQSYERDIELIVMEREAWHYAATELASQYGVTIQDKDVQNALDSYRDWLHARSTCPVCNASGIETSKSIYKCIACAHKWRVNEARLCALRRYSIQK
jgi:hypothetical protein